jgi:hypothetical protein
MTLFSSSFLIFFKENACLYDDKKREKLSEKHFREEVREKQTLCNKQE